MFVDKGYSLLRIFLNDILSFTLVIIDLIAIATKAKSCYITIHGFEDYNHM